MIVEKRKRGEESSTQKRGGSISERFVSNFAALQNYVQWDEKPHKGRGMPFENGNSRARNKLRSRMERTPTKELRFSRKRAVTNFAKRLFFPSPPSCGTIR